MYHVTTPPSKLSTLSSIHRHKKFSLSKVNRRRSYFSELCVGFVEVRKTAKSLQKLKRCFVTSMICDEQLQWLTESEASLTPTSVSANWLSVRVVVFMWLCVYVCLCVRISVSASLTGAFVSKNTRSSTTLTTTQKVEAGGHCTQVCAIVWTKHATRSVFPQFFAFQKISDSCMSCEDQNPNLIWLQGRQRFI